MAHHSRFLVAILTLGTGCLARPTDPNLSGSLSFSAISTAATSTCALTPAGLAYCWGKNRDGVLGDGTRADRDLPTAVTGGHTFAAIHTDGNITCALTAVGEAWCWGANNLLAPRPIGGTTRFSSISTRGSSTICGLAVSGTAYCTAFGSDSVSAIGDGLSFTALSTGRNVICGIDADGAAWCWGSGARGQLGDGTTLARSSDAPLKVVTTMKFASINVGRGHVCGIVTTKALVCWGSSDSGQTGTGWGTTAVGVPTIAGNTAFKSVSAGTQASCALTLAGYAYCWGWALFGGLGIGDVGLGDFIHSYPTKVLGDLTFAMISNSGTVTCGVTTTNVAYCWGGAGMELGVGSVDRYGFNAPRKIALQP